MANAKKLPSGNWRIRVYSHTDEKGIKHYESFTAPTKQQAEMLGLKFANDTDRYRAQDITVSECVDKYISANNGSLSPSTIKGYTKDARKIAPIGNIRIRKLNTGILQSFISSLSSQGLSPKTVSNIWGLLHSSLAFSGIENNFKIHLPKKIKKPSYSSNNDEIIRLLDNAAPKLKICIMLAAFHGLRRGEIAALKYSDLQGDCLYIHSDMVKGLDGWVHKATPKTSASNRLVYLTQKEIEMIGTGDNDDYIVGLLPSSITTNFYNLRKRLNINMSFHSLRSFFASSGVLAGVPDLYLSHIGGWDVNSKTLKSHYQKIVQGIDKEYAQRMNKYFENITDKK